MPPRFMSYLFMALAVATLTIGAASRSSAQECSHESLLKSPASDAAVNVTFRNAAADSKRLYWLDFQGRRKFFAVVQPGTTQDMQTFAGHIWVVTDDLERCLSVTTITAAVTMIDVGGPVAAQMMPPPAGVQQPIGQLPAFPVPPGVAAVPAGAPAAGSQPGSIDNPTMQGAIVDWCSPWAKNCGAGAANLYCQSIGFAGAADWTTFHPGRTWVIGSNQYCNADFCMGFSHVTCTN
jgi:hypothetical protein